MTTFEELAEAWIASREHCSGLSWPHSFLG